MAARKNVKRAVKKFTFSKIILLTSYIIGAALTVVVIVGAFKGYDVSAIGIVTTAAYTEIRKRLEDRVFRSRKIFRRQGRGYYKNC